MGAQRSLRLIGALVLAIALVLTSGGLVISTYYISDDFVLLYEAVRTGSGWQNWIAPFFGHFGPGSFALTRIVSGIWGLDRLGAAVFTSAMVLLALLLLYGIARAYTRGLPASRALVLALSSVSLASVGLAIPILFYALGASMLPLLVTTLAGVLAGLRAQASGRWFWWVVSAASVLAGLAFWELAAFNIVLVPLTVWALERARPQVGEVRARWLPSRSFWPSYGIPVLLGVALYGLNYRRFSFESGVRPADPAEILEGLIAWLGHGTASLLGGGPFPRPGQGLGLGDPLSVSPGSLAPWLVGMGIVLTALLIRRVRVVAMILLAIALLQGAAVLYARYHFLGPDFVVLNPRYYSGLVAYVGILFVSMWSVAVWNRGLIGRGLQASIAFLLVLSCVFSVASWVQFARQIGGSDRRNLVTGMLDAASMAPSDATMLASDVSERLGWLAPPYNNSRVILWPELGDWRWGTGNGQRLLVISPSGSLSPARTREVSAWQASAGSPCVTTVEMPFVKFDEPVARLMTLRLSLTSAAGQVVVIDLNGGSRRLEVPQGVSQQLIQQYWYGTMVIAVSGAAQDVCINQASIAEMEAQPS